MPLIARIARGRHLRKRCAVLSRTVLRRRLARGRRNFQPRYPTRKKKTWHFMPLIARIARGHRLRKRGIVLFVHRAPPKARAGSKEFSTPLPDTQKKTWHFMLLIARIARGHRLRKRCADLSCTVLCRRLARGRRNFQLRHPTRKKRLGT